MDKAYLIGRDMTDVDSSDLMIQKLLKQTRAHQYQQGTVNLFNFKVRKSL
ncbi:hypothetical protein [Pedobacter sp. Leaf170]|nr:hypothetical protein [Pedobacter sp. Leaf170]